MKVGVSFFMSEDKYVNWFSCSGSTIRYEDKRRNLCALVVGSCGVFHNYDCRDVN